MASILDPAEILQIHKDYADQFATLAQSGLQGAFSALSASGLFDFHPSQIKITFPDFGRPVAVGPLPKLPSDPVLPDIGTLLDFVEIPNPTFGDAPVPSFGAAPTFNAPAKPTTGTPSLTTAPPTVPAAPTMPTPPPYLALPSLLLPYPTINIPTSPVITQPIFDGQRPTPITAPDPQTMIDRYTTERDAHRTMLPVYARANADALIAQYAPEFAQLRTQINLAVIKYTDPVNGGGMSVPANVEAAIYARASDRNNLEFQRALATVQDTVGKQGFTLPTGAWLAGLRQARLAMGDAQVRSSTDIATKNVELEQTNFQFMLKMGEQIEEKMLETITQYITLALQMDAQSIASAKEIIAAYLGVYNLQVMVYKSMVDGYVADAEVLKARIAALDANVRLYEAQIRAELAKTEVNKATVDVLRVVADVNRALADTYKAQIDAALAPLEVARIQMQIFESRVRAFAAEVNAYEARWNAYKSEIDGALAPFKGYEAAAQGFIAQANGYRAQVEGQTARVNALAETNKARGGRNDATVRVFSAQADVAIKTFEGQVAGYSAESNVVIKQAEIEVEFWRTTSNLIFQEFNAALNQTFEYAREQMNLFRGQMEAAINAANGLAHAANVAGQLASGAMTGLTSFAGTLVSAEQ